MLWIQMFNWNNFQNEEKWTNLTMGLQYKALISQKALSKHLHI